jgi:hypothetical protein
MTREELREALAALEHNRWSRWEEYRELRAGTSAETFWRRKRELPYASLTEAEKETDRAEADRTLEIVWPLIEKIHAEHANVCALHQHRWESAEAEAGLMSAVLFALVRKLDIVHHSPEYRAVWETAQLHAGQYAGPQYIEELSDARAVLDGKRPERGPRKETG